MYQEFKHVGVYELIDIKLNLSTSLHDKTL
ncbi:MAG: hypothetical protein ACI8RY_001622 [Urechidicola sp.]|jgi:hypothetical protein